MKDKNQRLCARCLLRPKIVRSKNAVFLYRQAIERVFNILGIDILAAFCDNHVLLAPEELQMPAAVKAAQVTREQPAVNDRLGRKLRVVEIMRHHSLTVYSHLADSLGIGLQDSQFNSGQRLANGIREKWLEVDEGNLRTAFCESVPICHRNPEIVKEL